MKPVSPEEAAFQHKNSFPGEVIYAINSLISENYNGKPFTLNQDEIVARIIQVFSERGQMVSRSAVFVNNMLDFEPLYEDNGWKIEYDKPAYCESYPASFKFTPKKSTK